MADLLLVHFALIPGPVRKERQFSLPDDYSGLIDYYSLTDEPFRVRFSRAFRVFTTRTDRCSGIRKIFYTTRTEQEISTFPLSDVKVVAY